MESNKKTLFFSNIIGDIRIDEVNSRFNDNMTEYIKKNINNEYSMIFINAPGIGGEEYYLKNMMRCFEKAGIRLKAVLDVEPDTTKKDVDDFLNKLNKQKEDAQYLSYKYSKNIKKINFYEKNEDDIILLEEKNNKKININKLIKKIKFLKNKKISTKGIEHIKAGIHR